MQSRILIVLLLIAWLTGCQKKNPNPDAAPLSFYLVSEQKIEGGRFIDQANFEKLGYVKAAPDLTVIRLNAVSDGVSDNQDIMVDKNGKQTWMPRKTAIFIMLEVEDGKKMQKLTENAFGKRMLIMLGDTPLIAPSIRSPVSEHITLTIDHPADVRKIAEELKKLVP